MQAAAQPLAVLQRVQALLQGALPGVSVDLSRQDAFARSELDGQPGLLVEPLVLDNQPLAGLGGGGLHSQTFGVSVIVLTRAADWVGVLEPARAQVCAAIPGDTALQALMGGLALRRCEWRAASADLPFGACFCSFEGRFEAAHHPFFRR